MLWLAPSKLCMHGQKRQRQETSKNKRGVKHRYERTDTVDDII